MFFKLVASQSDFAIARCCNSSYSRMLFSGPTAARWNAKRPAGVWWEKQYRSTVSLRRNLTPAFLWWTPVMPRGSETKQQCTVLARVSVAILAQVLLIYQIVIRSVLHST